MTIKYILFTKINVQSIQMRKINNDFVQTLCEHRIAPFNKHV